MDTLNTLSQPLFRLCNEVHINAQPADVYVVVTDLKRSGEWSPECRGGEWISGEPATVGAVFRGENFRADDVVAWAPVVRGAWTTEAEVVEATPDRKFRWAMRAKSGRRQSSVWGFVIHPADEGSILTHEFQMDEPTEGINEITADMDAEEADRFFTEWAAKVQGDLGVTLGRIKEIIEMETSAKRG
jgi:hypothetical protein